jgi:hypothetical protein
MLLSVQEEADMDMSLDRCEWIKSDKTNMMSRTDGLAVHGKSAITTSSQCTSVAVITHWDVALTHAAGA